MKFFILDFVQKIYLNIVIIFNRIFNIGLCSKKKGLNVISFNLILYFCVYVLIVFALDFTIFNEEFFISIGLIIFILIVRLKLTALIMPFFFQYRSALEKIVASLAESIYLNSTKLYIYYRFELFYLNNLKKNNYGIKILDEEVLNQFVSNYAFNDVAVIKPFPTYDNSFFLNENSVTSQCSSSIKKIDVIVDLEKNVFKNNSEVLLKRIFNIFINDVTLNLFNFQYRLRLFFIKIMFKKKFKPKKRKYFNSLVKLLK